MEDGIQREPERREERNAQHASAEGDIEQGDQRDDDQVVQVEERVSPMQAPSAIPTATCRGVPSEWSVLKMD